ncbi:MAG: hypothetical protein WCF30_13210 [Terracidiphilus sp.]
MGKINMGRVLIAGLVAGIVGDILGYLVDGVFLAPQWTAGNKALGLGATTTSQLIWFNLLGLVFGIASIWLYAAIRPRFGAGIKTAVVAGVAAWVIGTLLPNLGFMWVGGLYSHGLTTYTTAGGLIESVAGTIVGAYLYKE